MGGDFGPSVTVPAALEILNKYPQLTLILVGKTQSLQKALNGISFDPARLIIQAASEEVAMDEAPALALRNKKDSSMRVAINLVKAGTAQACVSAGNTGALMATARFVLKTIPGIDRPAIVSTFPTADPDKKVRMLDLGANVDCTPEQLLQFAVMGSVLASAVDNMPRPKVHLLNIGAEEIKGNEQVKAAAQRLNDLPAINYAGYIEGDAIFKGEADIIVCDGFVGNIALKTTEGVAMFMAKLIKDAFMRNALTKIVGLLAKPVLKHFVKRVDPARYNGATLIGLKGTVIKSHGGAAQHAFASAIEEAIIGAEKNIPERIHHEVIRLLNLSSSPQAE